MAKPGSSLGTSSPTAATCCTSGSAGVRSSLWRNPLLPQDLRGRGNIERTVANVVPDETTGYALWLKNEVDASCIPDLELQAHLEQFPDEVEQIPDLISGLFWLRPRQAAV